MKQRFGGKATPLSARLSRVFTADRRHIHHILVAKYGGAWKAIFWIWLVTLLFAASAVMTVLPQTKVAGYTSGGAAFLLLLVLRYLPRRHNPD